MEIDYLEAPPLGHTHEKHGVSYELVATKPHTRRSDGAATTLLTWRGVCPVCGSDFYFVTGLRCKGFNRRCVDHHAPRQPATSEAKKAKRDGKRAGIATQRERRKLAKRLLS